MHSHLHLHTRASVTAWSSPSSILRHIVRYRAAIDQNSGGQSVQGLLCQLVTVPSSEAADQCYPRTLAGEDRPIPALEARRKRILLKLAQSEAANPPDCQDVLLLMHDGIIGSLAPGITVEMARGRL
jgi:hypothetical protein